ncbi:MAG TPA: peptidyl-prolyl cis-trans isomerase [Woeseiaceae bacterium]|nr:peptidyl-prolyl cis-trans isomerase [Woeseiaceae bacterium]
MLQNIRERFTGRFALAILLLLTVPFAFFGIPHDFTSGGYAAKVNDVEISIGQLQNAYQQALARYAQSGADIPPELHGVIRDAVLNNIIRETLVNLHLADAGYRITDQMITDFIRQVPIFQKDGEFSTDLYYAWLDQQMLAAPQFEESRRQAMRAEQFQRGIAATAFVTPAEYRRYLNLYGEQRRAAIATFDTQAVAEGIEIEDAKVAGYYEAHPEEFQAPESVDLAYIEIDRRDLGQDVEISDEELQAYYEQVKSRYLQDEQRKAHHILVAVGDDEEAARQEAAALAERARAGEPFEDLARQYSDDTGTAEQGGDLGAVLKSQMPGPLGDTIFSMQEGEIAGPVRSDFGFHIVRLDDVIPGGPLPLEQVRPELERELRDEKTADEYRALERKLSDALFDAQDLQAMADAAGLEVQTASGFTRAGGEPFGNNQAAIDAVFNPMVLEQGRISEIVELDANRTAVFKVREHQPAAVRPLEEVRDRIVAQLRTERAEEIVRQRAAELQAKLAEGADFAEAAKAAGAEVSASTMLRRQDESVDPRVLETIFRAPKPADAEHPSLGEAVTEGGDYAVYRVAEVQPGRPEAIPLAERDARKLQLAAESGRADFTALLLELEREADIVRAENPLGTQPAF